MSHDPAAELAESVRHLIDATIRTLADEQTITAARHEIDAITTRLTADAIPGSYGVQHRDGMSLAAGNVVIGARNAIAVPLTVEHREDGGVFTDFTLGAGYEGPAGHVHGGICALILDHVLGAAVHQPGRPAVTGTLTVRYRRPTPLGRPLHAEAKIRDSQGSKTFVEGSISHGGDVTVEADGIFLFPKR
ncbi:thioesterase [Mycolicibacterium parafortuitum]|uniref:PaaI family thioesterase n=1 Tax=Mycolicibacterium parafortuitum TaxID=39692 RepID=UPI0032C43C02